MRPTKSIMAVLLVTAATTLPAHAEAIYNTSVNGASLTFMNEAAFQNQFANVPGLTDALRYSDENTSLQLDPETYLLFTGGLIGLACINQLLSARELQELIGNYHKAEDMGAVVDMAALYEAMDKASTFATLMELDVLTKTIVESRTPKRRHLTRARAGKPPLGWIPNAVRAMYAHIDRRSGGLGVKDWGHQGGVWA